MARWTRVMVRTQRPLLGEDVMKGALDRTSRRLFRRKVERVVSQADATMQGGRPLNELQTRDLAKLSAKTDGAVAIYSVFGGTKLVQLVLAEKKKNVVSLESLCHVIILLSNVVCHSLDAREQIGATTSAIEVLLSVLDEAAPGPLPKEENPVSAAAWALINFARDDRDGHENWQNCERIAVRLPTIINFFEKTGSYLAADLLRYLVLQLEDQFPLDDEVVATFLQPLLNRGKGDDNIRTVASVLVMFRDITRLTPDQISPYLDDLVKAIVKARLIDEDRDIHEHTAEALEVLWEVALNLEGVRAIESWDLTRTAALCFANPGSSVRVKKSAIGMICSMMVMREEYQNQQYLKGLGLSVSSIRSFLSEPELDEDGQNVVQELLDFL